MFVMHRVLPRRIEFAGADARRGPAGMIFLRR